MINGSPDVKDAFNSLKQDDLKKEIIAISVGEFLKGFLEKHFHSYSYQFKSEIAIKDWLNSKLEEYIQNKNIDIINYLNFQQNRKFAVHIVVDGLQGNLVQALVGENEKFLEQIIADHQNRKKLKPKIEQTTELKEQQVHFLNSLSNDKNLLQDNSYLPFFKYLFHNYSHQWARQGISTTPTISVRNLPIAMTGSDVVGKSATGLPNFHYIDRYGVDSKNKQERAYYFFGNDALKLEEITSLNGMKSPFTRLLKKDFIKGMGCNTNYDKDAVISFDALLNLGLGEKVRDFGEINCLAEIRRRTEVEKKLILKRQELL